MLIDDGRINTITGDILGAAIEVHRVLGPGLLESVYAHCLQKELSSRGLRFVAQPSVPIRYKDLELSASYRLDLIVEDVVVVEIKSIDAVLPVHLAQTLTYLRLSGCRVALLINFNVPRLMEGVRRLINGREISRASDTRSTGRNGAREKHGEE